MTGEIRYPTGFSLKDIVSWGNSGLVLLDRSSQTVVKSPHRQENENAIIIERRIYERISEHNGHKGLLRYHGPYELGIRLEFVCNDTLKSFINEPTKNINMENLRLRWASQITDTLCFLHSKHVIHGDLTCSNIFLDEHLNAKLGDFGDSSLDGSPLLVEVTASYKYPRLLLSTQGDIFALSSTLYKIMIGVSPYYELSEEEIDDRYSNVDFPETNSLRLIGSIIKYYW